MIKTCRNCKYWDRDIDEYELDKERYPHGECTNIGNLDEIKSFIFTFDRYPIFTKPDFYCICWEEENEK